MELNYSQQLLILICCAGLFLIMVFFFVQTSNLERYNNNLIKACNVSRNEIAVDFDFNLIEYDKNKAYKPIEDFNIFGSFT